CWARCGLPDAYSTGVKVQSRYLTVGSASYVLTSNPYHANTSSNAAEATMGWTRAKYDFMGRMTELEKFSGGAAPCPAGSPAYNCATSNFNSTGKTTNTYASNQTSTTDEGASATITQRKYDSLGRAFSVVQDPGSALPTITTSYQYDSLGNLTNVSMPGQSRTFAYDSQSRLKSGANPESGATSYLYYLNGNLKTKTDANGSTTTSEYDALNRITKKTYTAGTSLGSNAGPGAAVAATPILTYVYDGVAFSKGKLTSVSTSDSSTTYSVFDSLGRVKQAVQSVAGVLSPYVFGVEYDLADNVTSMTYPSGRQVFTSHDQAGRDTAITSTSANGAATGFVASTAYAANGAVKQRLMGNGVLETYDFNSRLQLGGMSAVVNSSTPFQATFTYPSSNNNGNLQAQSITRIGASFSQSYQYDGLNRLKSALEAGWAQTYVYDASGNRAVLASSSQPSGSNLTPQTSSTSSVPFNSLNQWQGEGYDSAGYQTEIRDSNGNSVFRFGYDVEGRQVKMTKYSGSTVLSASAYSYGGDGRRVKKVVCGGIPCDSSTVGAVSTAYAYDPFGQLAAEYTTGNPGVAGTKYLTADGLGSTRLVTGPSGQTIACHDYLPFGEEIPASWGRTGATCYAAGQDPSPVDTTSKFTSKERDAETGLDYFGARYMSSAQGRFTSPDPLLNSGRPWEPQSWNRYAYTLNNPLRYSDPTGLYEWDATLGGGCADKALRSGGCSGFTKQQGRDIASERKDIRKQLGKLDKSKDALLHGAATAIGKENVDNGVTIGMGAVTPGAVAQVSTTLPLSIDANGNPELDLTVTPGSKGNSLFINLAHEGTHVADAQSVAWGAPTMTHMDTEMHAYGASVAAAQRLGWPSAGAGGNVFWSSSWSKVDQQTRPPQEIRNFLNTNPIYAPKVNNPAYQK
ncbi:MAG: RHS repeat-associated core domain-containing protein, partial [Bryobacteraceae bacterium]